MSQPTSHSKGASSVVSSWTCVVLVLLLACALPKATFVSGQGLSTAELNEPVGPQQKNIADMFSTNPNRLYDDFDGNTIYHKFHPFDDYVPPLPLTTPNASLTSGGTVQAFPIPATSAVPRYRLSLTNELEGFHSNALARKPPGPIAYHYNIIPPRGRGRSRARPTRPPPPKTPPSPITISSSSSLEPDNDIEKPQLPTTSAPAAAPAPAPVVIGQIQPTQTNSKAAASSQSRKYPPYEIYRTPAADGEENLPGFEVLKPNRAATAAFIPLRVTPNPTSGPVRSPYNTYGIYTSIPNAMSRTYSNVPIFMPVNYNQVAVRQWSPRTRPVYLPDPPNPPIAPSADQVVPTRPRAAATRRNNSRQTRAVQSGPPFQGQVTAYEPRPQLIGRQLRFPSPVAIIRYNNAAPMALPPPPPYTGVHTPRPPYAGWKFTPQSGMTGNQGFQGRPPLPSYRQFLPPRAAKAGPSQSGPIYPRGSYPTSPYLSSPTSNPVVSQSPRNWNPYAQNIDERLMPPPSYASSVGVRPFRPYSPVPSTGPYYNQSPRMGYFLPQTNSGASGQFVGVGGQQQRPQNRFIKQKAQEPGWQGQGFGQGNPPPFDAGQRSRPAPYYIPNQGLYTSPPSGFGYQNAQPGIGISQQQQPQPLTANANRGTYERNPAEARLAPWTGSTAVGSNQPVQFAVVPPNNAQPIPSIPVGGNSTNAAPAANHFANTNPTAAGAGQPSTGNNFGGGGGFIGPAFNNSGPGVSNSAGLRAKQELIQPPRSSADSQGAKVPDLSVNRGPMPFYSQADVDGHYRRMLAHNETPADSEFENDPRVLQWYLQRAKQVLQDRGRQAQGADPTGSGGGNFNNAQPANANSVQPGGSGQPSIQQPVPGPSNSGGQAPAFPSQQFSRGTGSGTPVEFSGFLSATPPANRFVKK